MTSIYFIPLFDPMEIPKEIERERCVFGFLTYQDYHSFYFKNLISQNDRILILEDFFPHTRDPLLASLFLLSPSFQNIVIWQNEKVLKKKIDDVVGSFQRNRTIYGMLKENQELEFENYNLIERRIIESKMGKLNLEDVVQMYDSSDLKSFFEKNEIDFQNVANSQKWKDKNLFRHYLYHLILEKRLHIYLFDSLSPKEIQTFLSHHSIFHTYL